MKQRSGPVLFVLLNAFKYTTEKVSECRTRALSYRENPTHRITPFAQDIYCSNKILSRDCILQDGVGEKWRVMEKSNLFEVDASNMDSVTCTCHRFFDEGIPCQHIILVLRHLRKENLAPSLIDHIYDKSLFELAFPDDLPFSPDDMDRYSRNLSVISVKLTRRRGAPQTRRYASTGEFRAGNSQSHRVSLAAHGQIPADPVVTDSNADGWQSTDSSERRRTDMDRCLASRIFPDEQAMSSILSVLNNPEEQCPQDDDDDDDESMPPDVQDSGGSDSQESVVMNRRREVSGSEDASDDNLVQCGLPDASQVIVEDSLLSNDEEEEHETGRNDGFSVDDVHFNTRGTEERREDRSSEDKEEQEDERACVDGGSQSEDGTGVMHHDNGDGDDEDGDAMPHDRQEELPSNAGLTGVGDANAFDVPGNLPRTRMVVRGPRPHQSDPASEAKRRRISLDDKFKYLVRHSEAYYTRWETLYRCMFSTVLEEQFLARNAMPTKRAPALVAMIPEIPLDRISCEELSLMSPCYDGPRGAPLPCISMDLIKKFLAHVHAFTTVGLEAQATAFSRGRNGVIKYLALLPQITRVGSIMTRESAEHKLDAVEEFKAMAPGTRATTFVPRCWIHTHPSFKAYMSSTDLIQLYFNACLNPESFGIVLSPKLDGVKALCVRLTGEGFANMRKWFDEAKQSGTADENEYVSLKLHEATIKLYSQIPFVASADSCQVVDLRSKEEVVDQLRDFIETGRPDVSWILSEAQLRNAR